MQQQIEALIFCSPEPVSLAELTACIRKLHGDDITQKTVSEIVARICEHYSSGPYPFEVIAVAGGYRFLTKPNCRQAVELLVQEQNRRRLSASALETLSIIAYRQPTTRAELEQVRGVSCDYALQKLLERGMIEIYGRKDAPGRPVLYSTTPKFMEHIGLQSLRDLPPLKEDLEVNEIGIAG